jgi:hypothetical protein
MWNFVKGFGKVHDNEISSKKIVIVSKKTLMLPQDGKVTG